MVVVIYYIYVPHINHRMQTYVGIYVLCMYIYILYLKADIRCQ